MFWVLIIFLNIFCRLFFFPQEIKSNLFPTVTFFPVSALFLPYSTTWNLELLHHLFSDQEIELITSLPLGRGSSDDKLIWPHVSLGIHSVKSGYNFLLKEKVSASLDNFQPRQLQGLWKRIWTCKVPNKVRNFLWRGCKNALPVKTNLVRHNVLAEDVCDHCTQLPEDTLLAVWYCPEIAAVWDSASTWNFATEQISPASLNR